MKVVKLVEYMCKDTISILRVLLSIATRGGLRGMIIHYRTEDGQEDTVFTGIYKASHDNAAGATMRMMSLVQTCGERTRRP